MNKIIIPIVSTLMFPLLLVTFIGLYVWYGANLFDSFTNDTSFFATLITRWNPQYYYFGFKSIFNFVSDFGASFKNAFNFFTWCMSGLDEYLVNLNDIIFGVGDDIGVIFKVFRSYFHVVGTPQSFNDWVLEFADALVLFVYGIWIVFYTASWFLYSSFVASFLTLGMLCAYPFIVTLYMLRSIFLLIGGYFNTPLPTSSLSLNNFLNYVALVTC